VQLGSFGKARCREFHSVIGWTESEDRMRIVLFVLSILALLAGSGIFAVAKTALHEIEGFILFLISAILLVGAAIVEAINIARKKFESLLQARSQPSASAPQSFATAAPAATLPPVVRPPYSSEPSTESIPSLPWSGGDDSEEAATALLEQVRELVRGGDRKRAVSVLQDLVARYPGTSAADKARQSLQRSGIAS
jgi:hypothetical protein